MKRCRHIIILSVIGGIGVLTGCAAPSAYRGPAQTHEAATAEDIRFSVFRPQPDNRPVLVNYEPLDRLLEKIVLYTGPSLRRLASRPLPDLGSHIVHGHTSRLRLEGNKVFFSKLSDDEKEKIFEIADYLRKFPKSVDIVRLPRDEQLAYWMNLHNMLVLAQIAKNYPAREPRKIKIGVNGQTLHDAPIVQIKGVPLSLRDIRTKIVFRFWQDPRVMYGFFHGDLASPNIRTQAWRASSISFDLGLNAHEFVNALRGVRRQHKTMLVSPLYEEARGTLFKNWPDDLRSHLSQFAENAVATIVYETEDVAFSRYEARTADLVGGQIWTPMSAIGSVAFGPNGYINSQRNAMRPLANPAFGLALGELMKKFDEIRRQRRTVKGRVYITDEPFDTPIAGEEDAVE